MDKTRRSRNTGHVADKYRSTTHYVLSGLIPYTEANVKLTFKPSLFFNDLEKLDRYKGKRSALSSSYHRAIENNLIAIDDTGAPHLTDKGVAQLRRYEPCKLTGAASILVIFDIPEEERRLRQRLRTLLRELGFMQVQKSVWQSEYDVLEYLVPELRQYRLEECVQVYESARVV